MMILQSLRIQQFQKIDQTTIHFTNPLTIIEGPNEHGKTTIIKALIAALFYNPTKPRKIYEEFRQWGAEKLYVLTLSFTLNGMTYTLHKDFEQKTMTLENTTTQEQWSQSGDIERILSSIPLLANEQLFTRLCIMTHLDIAELEKGKSVIQQALHKLSNHSVNNTQNTFEILKRIEKAQRQLTKGLDHITKEPGRIKQLQEQYQALQEKEQEITHKKKHDAESELQLQRNQQRYRRLQQEEQQLQKALHEHNQLLQLQQQLKQYHHEYNALQQQEEQLRHINKHIEESEEQNDANSLSSEQYHAILEKLYTLQEKMNHAKEMMHEAQHKQQTKNTAVVHEQKKKRIIILLLGIGCLASVVATFLVSYWLAILAALFAVNMYYFKVKNTTPEENADNLPKNKQQYAHHQSEMQKILNRHHVNSQQELEQRFLKQQQQKALQEKLLAERKGLLQQHTEDEIRTVRRKREKQIAILEVKKEKLQQEQEAPSLQYRQTLHTLQKNQQEQKEFIRTIERQQSQTKQRLMQQQEHIETQEALKETKEELLHSEEQREQLEVLSEAIQQAQQQATEELTAALEKNISTIFSDITNGTYANVHFSDDVSVTIQERETQAWIDPTQLSSGTQDQLYFAVRLALIQHIWKDTTILLLLDDPLLSFDRERLQAAKNMFQNLQHELQCVLVTHTPLYRDMITTTS